MGIFGSTKIYVSSVVYNLAGDVNERPNYLKTVVLSNIYGQNNFSMGGTIKENYMRGPGIQIRQFHRWTKTNYNSVGVSVGVVRDESDLDIYVMQAHVPLSTVANYAQVSGFWFGPCDYSYWSDQYMMAYHLDAFTEAWTSDYNATTNQITITRPGGITYTFTPANFDPNGEYFYIRYQERRLSDDAWQKTLLWIYKKGDGITDLDELVLEADTSDEFVAFIPLRVENQFISNSHFPTVYSQAKKAYRKLCPGEKIDDLIAKIGENESLGDIDHAYLIPGVALNVASTEGKQYIFEFFQMMTELSIDSVVRLNAYMAAQAAWLADYEDWKASRLTWADEHPGEPRPPPPVRPAILQPTTSIGIGGGGDVKLNMIIKWLAAEKITGTGLGKAGAQVGELWWGPVTYLTSEPIFLENGAALIETDEDPDPIIQLFWQKTPDYWESYKIYGLWHYNKIYKDKAVEIHAGEALEDVDESGFIIPLHYNTLKAMSLIDSTQLVMSSKYLVFNCYKIVKQKWYQTGIFKIFVFVAIIVVAVLTGGIGAGAAGIFGSAAGVGAAFGLTGVIGIIVGAIVNAVAAMIVAHILGKVSVAIFGEKWGSIIGAVVSFVAITVGSGLLNGQSMSSIWSSLGSAVNLINLTNALGSGISGYVQGAVKDLQGQMDEFNKNADAKMAEIRSLYAKNIGYDTATFNPLGLTGTFSGDFGESPTQFLDRTLMTGMDIAELSMSMLGDFTEVTLNTALPI